MRYGELHTEELLDAAEAEARALTVDPEALEGRAKLTGYALEPYGRNREGVLSATPEDDDAIAVQVSIVEVGDLIMRGSALQTYAQRRLQSIYRNHRITLPMFPRIISENKLSLLDEELRPVLTTRITVDVEGQIGEVQLSRNALVAQTLEQIEVDQQLQSSKQETKALTYLEIAARRLFIARHPEVTEAEAFWLEDRDGNALDEYDYSIGRLIVQEAMLAANAGMANYMRAHDIPGLYRIQTPTVDYEEVVQNADPRRELDRASYSRYPQEHVGLGLARCAPVTSPLNHYPDYVNQSNVLAHLQGKRYPFDSDHLRHVRHRAANLEAQDHPRANRTRSRASLKSQSARLKPADIYAQRINEGQANEADLIVALFGGADGTHAELEDLRHNAAQYVASNLIIARSVLNLAFAQGRLREDVRALDESTPDITTPVVLDAQGRAYELLIKRKSSKSEAAIAISKLLGDIAGCEVEPIVPESMTEEGEILHEPVRYLGKLARERRIRFGHSATRDSETGEVTVTLNMTINGETHIRRATAINRDSAERLAGGELIREFDLFNPPPEQSVERRRPLTASRKLAIEAPVLFLNTYAATKQIAAPTYETIQYPDAKGETQAKVRMEFIDEKGNTHTAFGSGSNIRKARHDAAGQISILMPDLPIKKKSKKKKTQGASGAASTDSGSTSGGLTA